MRSSINSALSAQRPVKIIALGWNIHRTIAFIAITQAITQAITAGGLTATVVVGDDVLFATTWSFASASPCDR